MINRKATQERLKAKIAIASKAQCKAWRRVQGQVFDLMIEYLQQEFDLTPAYYGVLSDAVVEKVISNKIESVPFDAPSVLIPDKEWISSLLIDCKKLIGEWDKSGKAEEILDEWERDQEKLKHGI